MVAVVARPGHDRRGRRGPGWPVGPWAASMPPGAAAGAGPAAGRERPGAGRQRAARAEPAEPPPGRPGRPGRPVEPDVGRPGAAPAPRAGLHRQAGPVPGSAALAALVAVEPAAGTRQARGPPVRPQPARARVQPPQAQAQVQAQVQPPRAQVQPAPLAWAPPQPATGPGQVSARRAPSLRAVASGAPPPSPERPAWDRRGTAWLTRRCPREMPPGAFGRPAPRRWRTPIGQTRRALGAWPSRPCSRPRTPWRRGARGWRCRRCAGAPCWECSRR